jgi:hypothetical protein
LQVSQPTLLLCLSVYGIVAPVDIVERESFSHASIAQPYVSVASAAVLHLKSPHANALLPFLLPFPLQDEAFGDFVARVGFAALRQYGQGYVPADKSGSLASVSNA